MPSGRGQARPRTCRRASRPRRASRSRSCSPRTCRSGMTFWGPSPSWRASKARASSATSPRRRSKGRSIASYYVVYTVYQSPAAACRKRFPPAGRRPSGARLVDRSSWRFNRFVRAKRTLKVCNGNHLDRLTDVRQFTCGVLFAGAFGSRCGIMMGRNEDSCLDRGDTDRDSTADQPQHMGQRLLRGLFGTGALAHSSRRYRQLDGACWSDGTAWLRGFHPRSYRRRPAGV
jgi:hypothetical protein